MRQNIYFLNGSTIRIKCFKKKKDSKHGDSKCLTSEYECYISSQREHFQQCVTPTAIQALNNHTQRDRALSHQSPGL